MCLTTSLDRKISEVWPTVATVRRIVSSQEKRTARMTAGDQNKQEAVDISPNMYRRPIQPEWAPDIMLWTPLDVLGISQACDGQ